MAEDAEHLANGWEPDAPVGDSYLRRFLFNWAADIDAHVVALGGRTLRQDGLAIADAGRPAGFYNSATLLAPLPPGDPNGLLAAIDAFSFAPSSGSGTMSFWSAWPDDAPRTHDWILGGHPPLMLRPPGGNTPPLPPVLRIEEARTVDALRAFEDVAINGFPFPDSQPVVPGALLDPAILDDSRSRKWVGWFGDRPVAVASAFVDHGIVNVDCVATLPDARRQGFGAALTWQATLADPTLPAMLITSDDGRPVYERMGYLPLFRLNYWSRNRPASGDGDAD